MKGTLPLGRVGGVQLRVHVFAPIVIVLVAAITSSIGYAIGFVCMIVAHELGHAFLARRAGFVVTDIVLNLAGGSCRYRGNVSPRADAVIAWGGVLAQAVLVLISVLMRRAAYVDDTLLLGDVLDVWLWPNAILAAFNLIPAPAFDGGKAWQLFRPTAKRIRLRLEDRANEPELDELAKRRQKRPKDKFDIN
jgi:Zn-dependent protease